MVVAAATGNGAEFASLVECLVNRPGVVGQAADDSIVDLDEVAQPSCLDVADDGGEFVGRLAALDEVVYLIDRETDLGQFFAGDGRVFTVEFVDDLVKVVSVFFLPITIFEKVLSGATAAEAYDEVVVC